MSAVHQSRAGRLSFLAVLVWLWAAALAQAHVKTASIAQTRLSETPLLSLRLERENPCWQGVSLEEAAHLTLESRIGIFCGGDPINSFDPDGRCVSATANFVYNGGAAGYGLRQLGGYLDSYNNSSAGGGYFTALSGTVVNELAGASAPSTYVNGLQGFGNNVSTIYNDGGLAPAASYAISGWNVGKIYSGGANLDLVTGEPVGDWYARGTQIASGTASTAGIAAGGLGVYNWATAAPASVPPVIPTGETPPPLMYHYTTAPESSFARGLWRDSSVTDKLYTDPLQASQELGIPPPNKVIPIQDAGQFVPNKPSIVQRSFRFQGGGTDFVNPQPVPPSQILPARPLGGN